MTVRIASLVLLLVAMIGCSSSKPAPQPFTWNSNTNSNEAQDKLRQAEAQQPCSPENLKNATPEQRRKCDPTTGMFDNIKPAQPKSTTSPPTAQTKKVAAKTTTN